MAGYVPPVSRAFVTETDREEAVAVPPLALPPGVPNRITPDGAARLRAELAALLTERARLRGDDRPEARARLLVVNPRIALLEARLPTWVETACAARPPTVVFGARVKVSDGARTRDLRVVGVDEVDPPSGQISFLSPLAAALLGATEGDVVTARTPRGEDELEILEIRG